MTADTNENYSEAEKKKQSREFGSKQSERKYEVGRKKIHSICAVYVVVDVVVRFRSIDAPLAFSVFENDGKIRFRFKIEMKFLAKATE